MSFEPNHKDLLKSIPDVKLLSDDFQAEILEFATDQYNNGHEDGLEDINEDEVGYRWAYYEYENCNTLEEFLAVRNEAFIRTMQNTPPLGAPASRGFKR